MKLRKHQHQIIEVCREILSGKPVNEVILSVTPGGGKSFVPVIVADNLIPAKAEKLCWVVPRDSLKYQGESEFCDPRWNTAKRLRAAENGSDLSRGCDGYVTTYQAVGQNPDCHKEEFARFSYILFLDEFHHVASGSEWEKALRPLIEKAVLVIKASGTLSRGDGNKIAFLSYNADSPDVSDTETRRVIQYTRKEAIAEKAILKVRFKLIDADCEWEEQDGNRNTSKLSGEESAKALFTALRTEFADTLLTVSLSYFAEIRRTYGNAKLLVVAPNIQIAKTYYDFLARQGISARIATSEDSVIAKKNITDYKRGVYEVLVTVAMAYEGLNVPEIAVICCLSHIRSVPWLEQCFARANRLSEGKTDAVIFAPADWAFKKALKMIESEQLVPLENPETQQELCELKETSPFESSGEQKPWIIPVNSKADVQPAFFEQSRTAQIPCTPSEAEKILRKNIHRIVESFIQKQKAGSKTAHSKLLYRRMKNICNKPIAEMERTELETVWQWVKKEYENRA